MRNVSSNPMIESNMMPLLMSFTPSTRIQEETNPFTFIYNDENQIVAFDMKIVGTRCLKSSRTGNKGNPDMKNELDDQKNG